MNLKEYLKRAKAHGFRIRRRRLKDGIEVITIRNA